MQWLYFLTGNFSHYLILYFGGKIEYTTDFDLIAGISGSNVLFANYEFLLDLLFEKNF